MSGRNRCSCCCRPRFRISGADAGGDDPLLQQLHCEADASDPTPASTPQPRGKRRSFGRQHGAPLVAALLGGLLPPGQAWPAARSADGLSMSRAGAEPG